jgi:hypothetical protein
MIKLFRVDKILWEKPEDKDMVMSVKKIASWIF